MDGWAGGRCLCRCVIFSLNTQRQIAHNLHGLGRERALSKSPTAWADNKARVWISIGLWWGGGTERWMQAGGRKGGGADERRRDRRMEGKRGGIKGSAQRDKQGQGMENEVWKWKQMEVFYIEADRWMTGGASRGQGGEIITKIERQVNDRRGREKGMKTLQHGG